MRTEAPIDIARLNRADIAKIDWSRVMIEGDRSKAVLPLNHGYRQFVEGR